jgi:hypothetical protein
MTQVKNISRRTALARLGLTAAAVYVSPGFLGISQAHAASSATEPSEASAPSPASNPSPVSDPSTPTAPSSGSSPSSPSQLNPSRASGPSSAGSCRQTSLPDGGQITRQEYERAQEAIARGDARPLREVLDNVQSRHAGRLLRVGFENSGSTPAFRVVIVNRSGAIVSVTVDARSGQITKVQNC